MDKISEKTALSLHVVLVIIGLAAWSVRNESRVEQLGEIVLDLKNSHKELQKNPFGSPAPLTTGLIESKRD